MSTLQQRSAGGDLIVTNGEDIFTEADAEEKNLPECKIKRNYSCANCEYFTQNPRHYLYHLRDVHNEKVKIYECPNCLYASKHFQKLLRHTKMVHGSTDGIEIPENTRGKKRTADEEDIESSPADSEEENSNTFKCEMCAYSAKNRVQLSKHEREEHATKAKHFKCGKCTYTTSIKARFTKHTKYHSMPMIKCEMCDFRTPYKWNLDRHCKNHNGSGAFKCSACNFTADIKQSLTVHEMNHHVPPVGQAAGLGVGRRRNKVGASDSILAEEIVQVVRSSATETAVACESETAPADYHNNNNITPNHKKVSARKPPPYKKSKTDQLTTGKTYGSDFIDPDDIIHHANGNIYIKNKCKLCNYKSAWDGEMAKHEEKAHNIVRTNGLIKPVKKAVRPIPNLIPIPSQAALTLKNPSRYYSPVVMMSAPPPAVTEPVYTQKDYYDICAKSVNSDLKDLASLFGSEDMFKKPEKGESSKIPDLLPASNTKGQASFFDKFKAKLATNKLTCELCGHESKCLTESAAHQKTCGKESAQIPYTNSVHTVSSTRCQYCRQRCKSSTDLLNHLQTCAEALKRSKNPEDDAKKEESSNPHPMENRVFVWNNIEVPLDVEMESTADDSQYEYIEEKQDDNISLDLSIRTHSPSSESSFVVNHEMQQQQTSTTVSEKIPTHGNDISVAQHKRVFKCPHCTFWASTASRFHVHIVGHLNRKPFECSLCSYRSNWRWDITKHIKLKSVRDPNHESAKVLMTDETGRRNYTKYNKYLTEINVSGEHNETCGGFGTRGGKNHDSTGQVSAQSGKAELPKLTRAPSSSDFRPLLRNQRPPPGLKAADESFFARMANDKKKNGADSKKTMWKCKKCNFRDVSRDKLLAHVRDHYPPKASPSDAGGSTSQDIDERHCRLKHSGDIRVVIGTKNSSDRMEIDDQIEEQDHIDLPQNGTFKCKQCPFSNNDNDIFERHLEGHSPTPDRPYKCTICLYNTSHREELFDHLKLHGIADVEDFLSKREKTAPDLEVTKRYKCSECPYVTNSKSQFANHKQFHIPRGGEYACTTCGYNVSKRHLLHQHLKVHGINVATQKQNGDLNDLEDGCDEIEEVVQQSGDLQSYPDIPLVWVSKNGKVSKMYKCRYCPHVNLRKINIQEHEKMHGTREKHHQNSSARINETEHKCQECNYVCNNAGVLSSHSKVHQGLYGKIHGLVDATRTDEEQIKEFSHSALYQPAVESMSYDDEEDDEDEMALSTSGDAILYFCNQCPARFFKENEFDLHLRFHGARLNYKCFFCTYTGRQNADVLAHRNVHTDKYQERTKILKEMHASHPDYPPPAIQAVGEDENGPIYVVNEESDSKSFAFTLENEVATPKSSKASFTVPLSGTELFQQRNQAQQQQQSRQSTEIVMEVDGPATSTPTPISDELSYGGAMQGNPDFIYPTCIKNGRMKEKRYKCHKCPSAFEKRDQYKNHLTLHGAKQKYKCEYCDYSVKYYANYTQHLKKHKNSAEALAAKKLPEPPEIPVKQIEDDDECCNNDDETGDSPKTISERRSSGNSAKEGEEKKLFQCSICPYTNYRKDAVENHQKRHKSISGSSSTYTCEHCDYTVPQSHFLRDHCKLHFSPSRMAQPEGYMICDNIKLTSRKVDNSDEKSSEDDVKTEENVIFEDKGCEEEIRFDPPLKNELPEVAPADKVIVNPETGEYHGNNNIHKASTSSQLSGIDLSIVNREDTLDSHISSDN